MNAPTKRRHSEHEAEEEETLDPSLRGLNQEVTVRATQTVDPNRPKLYEHKQKLSDIIRAAMIVAGDKIEYKGGKNADQVNCMIVVREISSSSALNLTITFLSTPDPASPFSTLPPPVQTNADGVNSPTKLEDILLSHYGVDTANLPAKFRRTWPSFTIIRNGESQGTLANLRRTLYEKRVSGDKETLEKMAITSRRPKQTKGPEGQSTPNVQQGVFHDAEQMQASEEQREQEKDHREALDNGVYLARELYRSLRDLVEDEWVYPLLKQHLVKKITEIKEKCSPELWAVATEGFEFN